MQNWKSVYLLIIGLLFVGVYLLLLHPTIQSTSSRIADISREELMNEEAEMIKEQYMAKIDKLELTVQELRALQSQGQDFVRGRKDGVIATAGSGPSYEHEMARFRLADNILDMWSSTKSQLMKLNNTAAKKILDEIGHKHRSIEVDLMTLSNVDNNQDWRENEHKDLQDLMQRRIYHLQNPKDCSKAKKLLCDMKVGCGFGCQFHHVNMCLMMAYGLERTLILQSDGFKYTSKGWDSVFKPVSDTCKDVSEGQTELKWSGEAQAKDVDVVIVPVAHKLKAPPPPFMPLSVPEDLAPRLQTLHGDPSVWFISQFVKYLMRPQKHLQDDIDSVKEKMNFKNPIVGIQVRRTDKLVHEAKFHGIEEYMEHVHQWFLTQERIPNRIDKRRVYIASDDPTVLPEARKKYPDYEFYGNVSVSQKANCSDRYSDNSLRGVLIDIYMLSMTDYLVCTFSSNICRLVYEKMQTLHPDPSRWYHSLDSKYGYFWGYDKRVIVKYPTYPEVPLTAT